MPFSKNCKSLTSKDCKFLAQATLCAHRAEGEILNYPNTITYPMIFNLFHQVWYMCAVQYDNGARTQLFSNWALGDTTQHNISWFEHAATNGVAGWLITTVVTLQPVARQA